MKKFSIVLAILTTITISSILLAFNLRNNHKFVEVNDYTRQMSINYLNSQVKNNHYTLSKQEFRTLLEDELDFDHYVYKEGNATNGGYSVTALRYIKMDKSINIEQYCIILCHEMCHIKYFTANEIYTQFMTFKTLYESTNKELKQVGIWFGIYILNREYSNNYDCSKLIVDYLKEI